MSTVFCPTTPAGMNPFECNKLLEEFRDQPELITRLLQVFMAETQTDIDNLKAAFASQDASRVARIAHRLKGSAATMGAELLRAEAERIERHGRQGQLGQALERMSCLLNEYALLCRYVSGLAAPETQPEISSASKR